MQRQLEQKVLSEHRLELEKDASAISMCCRSGATTLSSLPNRVWWAAISATSISACRWSTGWVNIQAIEARFDELIARKRFGEKAIYTAFVPVDDAGRLVASSGNEEEVAMLVGRGPLSGG